MTTQTQTRCEDFAMFGCKDCETCTLCINEYYMVTDEVWEGAGLDNGMVCIACLEARVGRTLRANDFADCELNTNSVNWIKSERLASRLAG